MEGADTAGVMVVDTGEDFMPAMQEDLVEGGFMAEVMEDITVVDGMEEAITGEDVASIPITRIEDLAILTSVITLITTPTTLTGIGLRGVILGGGVIGFECHTIIEGEAPTNRLGGISCDSALCASLGVYYNP